MLISAINRATDRWLMQRVSADELVRDLAALVSDLDQLLKATEDTASEAVLDVRERIKGSLTTARRYLEATRTWAEKEAAHAVRSTDDYMRDNAWKTVGLAAGVGFLVGALAKSRRGRTS